MGTVEILIACALGLILLGAVLGVTTVRQIRKFVQQVREDERRAAEEDARRREDSQKNDESGAKI